ncbi:hypothetical protein [Mucilaginibacter gotjawali]|uniref:Uncharacterized protein n=2 Tax=Mucilaginibacter gotjawali TaxID=1550579 RepID=A0A125T2F5_9SPHI|nr:hypothetical protein [Mucilaginibacter gotjawali]MBB3057252.1 hypothetical protein [Mucilaginibacter gotjawali]BAU52980.1 hypothetical protein MgSA37_01147 [Mucilaginibacter gotjawali]
MALFATIGPGATGTEGTKIYGEILISLFDADTGQPANGNNVTVYFTQNLNGVIYQGSQIIAGQTYAVYHGELSDSSTTTPYYTKFTIDSISTEPANPPPVNVCDLVINTIIVDKPESSPGTADGQITVQATSSYGPITYSLDNITFQSSPIFAGLTGGLKNVYVSDANGCINVSAITIPVLSGLLVSDPSVSLTGGNVSRWNAAFNPVVFTYQRKDFDVISVSLDTLSGNAAIMANCDKTALIAAVKAYNNANANAVKQNIVLTNNSPVLVYINAGVYTGTYQVNEVKDDGSLVINTPYISNATGYINSNTNRPFYQVRTKITYQDPVSGQQNTIISTNRPDNTGLVKADISNFLQSLLRAKDDSNFTQINYRDSNLSASYQVAYAEYWDGKLTGTQSLTYVPVSTPYYVVYAAKQLGDNYGGNLAAYVPFPSVTTNSQLAKWVTDFAEPAFSNGYPFDIGFIYSEELLGLQLYCNLVPLDINRNPLSGTTNSYLLNEDGTWLLNQDGGKLVIARQTSGNTNLPAQLGLNRLLVNAVFDSDVYYFELTLMYNDSNGVAHVVTQTQTVRVDDAVDEQSVYLRWIGLSGCWNYYRFVYNQEVSLDVQNAVIIKNYVSDWANQDGIEEVIGKSAGQKMKVMAEDLSINDIKGLQSIKYSPKVQMLVNKNPVKWQTIVLNTATFSEYETINGQAPFSVTFNMPSINIQSQ